MRVSLRVMGAIATTLLVASAAAAQTIDPEFLKAREARILSIANGNADTFARYTTESFIVTDGNVPEVQNKAQRVARHRALGASPVREDEHIVPYNNDTIVLSWRQAAGPSRAVRIMEIWVKEGGVWKAAAVQTRDVAATKP